MTDPRAALLIESAKAICPGCRLAWCLDGWKHRSPANSECVAKEQRTELRAIAARLRGAMSGRMVVPGGRRQGRTLAAKIIAELE